VAITQIVTRLIKDLAVTAAKLADGAVTLAKLGALTTKGDLLVSDGSAHQRLGVGTNGQVLTADSTAGNGVKWATPTALSSSNFVFGETPSGTVDGTNTNFTLANTPTAGTVVVFVNGVRMNAGAGNDYTISGTTITFLSGAIPQTGDVLLVDYLK
jgi:hypothetical protein